MSYNERIILYAVVSLDVCVLSTLALDSTPLSIFFLFQFIVLCGFYRGKS